MKLVNLIHGKKLTILDYVTIDENISDPNTNLAVVIKGRFLGIYNRPSTVLELKTKKLYFITHAYNSIDVAYLMTKYTGSADISHGGKPITFPASEEFYNRVMKTIKRLGKVKT